MTTSAYYLLRLGSQRSNSVSVVLLSDDELTNLRYVIDTANTQQIHLSNGSILNPNKMYLSYLSFQSKKEAKEFFWSVGVDDIIWFESFENEDNEEN